MSIPVAILISGGGSNMIKLIESMQRAGHPGHPAIVISNRPDAGGIARAKSLNVPTQIIDHKDYEDREAFEIALKNALEQAGVEFLCLAGFMRILGKRFVGQWQGKMLNIHPSLLPKYKGLNTHQRALDSGDECAGCSVHGVTPALDDGPIYGQACLRIVPNDTVQTLGDRVLRLEHNLYPAVLRRVLDGEMDCLYIDNIT